MSDAASPSSSAALPVTHLVQAVSPSIVERVELLPRAARYARPPAPFTSDRIGRWLDGKLGGSEHAYLHQALSLKHIAAGENLVVATGTASGKSLIFMAAALREVLDGDGTILVFYPQKALGGDQLVRWQAELTACDLPPDLVGEITGEVPMSQRERVLEQSRIILATPDVMHCWMMRMLHVPVVRAYLGRLRFIVIDEAHALEAVFGSQFAYFFRRLRSARRRLCPGMVEPQVIAATATLFDPLAHMRALTGMPFALVDEDQNGAPSHGTTLLHIEGPDCGAPAERAAAEIFGGLVDGMPEETAAIAFADSRQGIERIVRRLNRNDVVPYRGGYSLAERRGIERALRQKELRAICSTSACELGIDIPQFAYGLNVGIPGTRKSLRQRAGRIGRSQPGVFAVMAPRPAFAQLGSSLREVATGTVERSPLYLENLFIQFQQACCFLREMGSDDDTPELEPELEWPAGFAEALALARPGAKRPPMLDEIASAGLDNPHLAFFLRSMPGTTFALKHARTGDTIGTIDHEKALREAYPGGTYIHFGQPYRVTEWKNSSYEHAIRVQPIKNAEPTQPIIRFQVGASVEAAELIEQHLLSSSQGCLAETQLRVVESVEGYRIGRTALLYKDLREKDRRLNRRQREFMTTGILLRISDSWFTGSSEHQTAARKAVADALMTVLCREYGVAPGDVRAAHTGIAYHSVAGARKVDDAIAIFDTVAGGLRLTAPVFSDFAGMMERLAKGADLAGAAALLSAASVAKVDTWYAGLCTDRPIGPACHSAGSDRLLIYAPESRVSIKLRGEWIERVLVEPQLITTGDGEHLMYRYEASPGVQAWVAHDQVQPLGNNWRRAHWEPLTNQIELLEIA